MFFPIGWMLLAGFKTEVDAVATPPPLFFQADVRKLRGRAGTSRLPEVRRQQRRHFNRVDDPGPGPGGPGRLCHGLFPTRRTKGTLLWMMSTRMLPPVGVLVPIYLLFRDSGLLDTRIGLLLIDAVSNLPIVVWMLFTFFKEIPREVLEAARMDGARLKDEIRYMMLPLSLPGIASTALLSIILAWNESFWSLNLTAANAAPLTAFIASFSSPEGFSGPSCPPRRPWRSRRSWSSGGSINGSWCAV